MSEQPEALRLADIMDTECGGPISLTIELRRLHEVNQELLKILAYVEASDLGSMLCARARAAIAKAKGESNE